MENSVEYQVVLKYIKRASLPVERTQKLAEFMPVFNVKGSGEEKRVTGKVEARARVFLPEFLNFARKLGFSVDASESLLKWLNLPPSRKAKLEYSGSKRVVLKTGDDYAYLRLMIYSVVMSILKNPNDWGQLEDYVSSMEPMALRFWASKIRNTYWKYGNRRRLDYLARRFLEVEWI
ncbi:hypothetical protein [Thermococcus celer]|uniref:Uncharacterized protein n=1 Tax=Thermococcus celer Vu 13 = JCM 8558 TaxID=1293037 RepID=A0A218P3U9_THECE|nr:hypothetical protein [Thermococcus celer]ASI99610.1 hypothetical protein A3L02_08590 [Thermococcus celer Vu 13 = JCM 8558]